MAPLYRVAVQLNTLTADGIATSMLRNENTMLAYTDWLLTNMWWPQTKKPRTAMAMLEKAINEEPKGRVLEKEVSSALPTPIEGKTMMDTAGGEKNKKRCWNSTGSPPRAG